MTTSTQLLSAVATTDLVKVFGSGDTAVRALDGVTAAFARAQFTAIMGPSGSGKSTLMHCLAGLDTASAGSVRIGDTELSGLSDKQLTLLRRQRVGFVFQSFNLLPTLTAAQNIRLPLDLAGTRPDLDWWDRVIGSLGLAGRLSHRPSELSGGQQQRVAIARALAGRPGLLIADEPTSQLDLETGRKIMELLLSVVRSEGITALVATHDEALIDLADKVISLEDGSVIGIEGG